MKFRGRNYRIIRKYNRFSVVAHKYIGVKFKMVRGDLYTLRYWSIYRSPIVESSMNGLPRTFINLSTIHNHVFKRRCKANKLSIVRRREERKRRTAKSCI